MQTYLKLAVISAAIGLASGAAVAQENISPPVGDVTMPATGSGSLVFYAWDSIAGTSLTVNLGLDLDSVLPSALSPEAGRSISFGVLSGFSTAFAAGTSNLRWALASGDLTADDDSGSHYGRRLATTSLTTPSAETRNSAMTNAISNLNDFAIRINDDANCATGTPCVAGSANPAYAFLLENNVDGLIGGAVALNFQNTGTISQSLEFFLFSGGGATGSNTNNTVRERYQNSLGQGGTWSLTTDGLLSWNSAGTSVVPLPAAAWLLFSGLAGFGVISRRRGAPVAAAPVAA